MNPMNRYTHLFFDLDDTLLDFKATERKSFIQLMVDNGLPFSEGILERYNQINQSVWQDLEKHLISSAEVKVRRFELFCREFGYAIDPGELSRQYLANLGKGVDRVEGADDLLCRLAGKYNLALITNGLSVVQNPRIKRSGFDQIFSAITISEEVGVSKPSNAFFEIAWERAGKPEKAKTLVVGDSLSSDMKGGIDFGMDTCWFNPHGLKGGMPVTYEIRSLPELLPILGLV